MAYYQRTISASRPGQRGSSHRFSSEFSEDEGILAAKAYDGTIWLVIPMGTKNRPGVQCSHWTIDRVYPNGVVAMTTRSYSKKDTACEAAQKEAAAVDGALLSAAYSRPERAGGNVRNKGRE